MYDFFGWKWKKEAEGWLGGFIASAVGNHCRHNRLWYICRPGWLSLSLSLSLPLYLSLFSLSLHPCLWHPTTLSLFLLLFYFNVFVGVSVWSVCHQCPFHLWLRISDHQAFSTTLSLSLSSTETNLLKNRLENFLTLILLRLFNSNLCFLIVLYLLFLLSFSLSLNKFL